MGGPPFPPYPPGRMAAGGHVALKVLIGSAIGLMLGFGTCGLGAMLQASSHSISQALVPTGLFLFVISVLGLVFSALWLLVAAIVSMTRK
jgi:hypothetical protein